VAPRLLIKTRVAEVRDEAIGIRSFTLVPVHREELPPYAGGASTIVQLPNGMRRNYSLCGDPSDCSRWRIAVLREADGRGGSMHLHDEVAQGDVLWASHPQDGMQLDAEAERHVLIAGGIGITPMLALLRQIEPGREVELHYCARSAAHAAFVDELDAQPGRHTIYRGDRGERLDVSALVHQFDPRASIYVCGPQRLLTGVREAMAHWPEDRLRFEAFAGVDPVGTQGEPFDVELAASRRTVHVPADRSLLAALHEAGVTVDSACEAGICRSCKVGLLAGEAVHRDLCLSNAEREEALLACVSRGVGTLSLML
jgi:ferredoxin-NADP reductase